MRRSAQLRCTVVSQMFTTIRNMPGFLPDTAEDVDLYESAADAWSAIIDECDARDEDLMYIPVDPADPEGPQQRSAFALELEDRQRRGRIATVYGPDGYAYSVDHAYAEII